MITTVKMLMVMTVRIMIVTMIMKMILMALMTLQGVQRKERDIAEFTNRLGEEQASVGRIVLTIFVNIIAVNIIIVAIVNIIVIVKIIIVNIIVIIVMAIEGEQADAGHQGDSGPSRGAGGGA